MAKQLTFAQFEERMRRADKRLIKSLHKQLTILALQSERQAKKNATTYPRRRTGELYKSINYYEERVDDARYHSLQDMNRDMITMLTAELEQIESSVPQSMKESRVANIKSQMLADINWSL